MKRPNPYIWLTIIWCLIAGVNAVSCVLNFVDGNLAIGAIVLCVSVGFAFTAGRLFEKAKTIAEFNRTQKWLHDFAKDLAEMGKELEKAKQKEVDGDPFTEFIDEKNIPFPEINKKDT